MLSDLFLVGHMMMISHIDEMASGPVGETLAPGRSLPVLNGAVGVVEVVAVNDHGESCFRDVMAVPD